MKFIKQNWFKLIIITAILIVGISTIWYFVVRLPQMELNKQLNLEQQQCSDKALKMYEKTGLQNNISDSYNYNWNQNLKKCFILQLQSANSIESVSSKTIYDVYTGEMYGSFISGISKQQAPSDCEMYQYGYQSTQQICKSEAEFDNFTKQFMNN